MGRVNMNDNNRINRLLKAVAITASVMAIVQLALSQLLIKITRLSAVETTGISLFAYIIFSLVTLFAVSRMKEYPGGKVFAVLMCLITAFASTWYLKQLFTDEIFFRNLYYTLNRQTQEYSLNSIGERIFAAIPLGIIIIGTLIYYVCGLVILTASLVQIGKNRKNPVNESTGAA